MSMITHLELDDNYMVCFSVMFMNINFLVLFYFFMRLHHYTCIKCMVSSYDSNIFLDRIGQETLVDESLADDEIQIELESITVQLAYVQQVRVGLLSFVSAINRPSCVFVGPVPPPHNGDRVNSCADFDQPMYRPTWHWSPITSTADTCIKSMQPSKKILLHFETSGKTADGYERRLWQKANLKYIKKSSIMEQDTNSDKNSQACYGGRSGIKQKKLENQLRHDAKVPDLEVEWSGSSHIMVEALSRIKQREEASVKRERAMACAFSHQRRAH
ncbi:hypothetical protein Tco_0345169 [Tanacetum coccineum]